MNPIQLFQDGGRLMWVNLGVLIFVLATVADRVYALTFRLRVNDKEFFASIEPLVRAGNYDRAIKICQTASDAAVPQVVRQAIKHARHGRMVIVGAIDEAVSEVSPQVNKRAGVLWGLANLATLIGLVGTVFGLIQSFAAISLAAPDQKSTLLTEGIAHAMSNTAFGLAIATFCVLSHMFVSSMARGVMMSVEHASIKIENLLCFTSSEQGSDGGPAQS